MCGIHCSVSRKAHRSPDPSLLTLLQQRGPDSTGRVTKAVRRDEDSREQVFLTFTSTVLSLRGSVTVDQPYEDPAASSVLCWNGEAWSIGDELTDGNDTIAVANLLTLASKRAQTHNEKTDTTDHECAPIAQALAKTAGPYAFVYYSAASRVLYFGRDLLGRRSLLWRVNEGGELEISSVAPGSASGSWLEVEADGIYSIKLFSDRPDNLQDDTDGEYLGDFEVSRTPYASAAMSQQANNSPVIPFLSLSEDLSASPVRLTTNSSSVSFLDRLLRRSLELRILNIPDPPDLHTEAPDGFRAARLAVLFSGGLDCTVLARLAHDLLPLSEPIDLLSVAFENPRIHKPAAPNDGPNTAAFESCPDRITGRASFKELQETCPQRHWRFMSIDVPYTETMKHRDRIIALMHPHNTEMDLSIASALYFAARGMGEVATGLSNVVVPYTTTARVLLSGLGADELFAGYTRHATAFSRHGFKGLIEELKLDIGRLGKRNLGRDDRMISNWGREARFPFLDEHLVAWALKTQILEKCDFGARDSLGHGTTNPSAMLEPGKKVLRCLAWKLGMHKVASEKKRAVSAIHFPLPNCGVTDEMQIQFGARTAKMQTGKTKGTTLLS